MQQTVDAYVDVYIPSSAGAGASAIGVLHILREAFVLFARSTNSGNAKASTSGTGNKYGPHALFYLSPARGLAGKSYSHNP